MSYFTVSSAARNWYMHRKRFVDRIYNSWPRQCLYWSEDDDVAIPLILRSMSRKRFEDIKKFIHFADNDNLTAGDKLAKIRPLQDKVNASLQQLGFFEKDLSIDEQMVPYFGRHFAKMFIRGKPIRFENKNWVLASSDGYPYKFETYPGSKRRRAAIGIKAAAATISGSGIRRRPDINNPAKTTNSFCFF